MHLGNYYKIKCFHRFNNYPVVITKFYDYSVIHQYYYYCRKQIITSGFYFYFDSLNIDY